MRFCTDPLRPGTEQLVVSAMPAELSASVAVSLRCSDIIAGGTVSLLPPMSLFMVKGWSRCLAAVACMLHAYEEPEVLEAPSRGQHCH